MVSDLRESVDSWLTELTDSSLMVSENQNEIMISGIYRASYYYEGLEVSLSNEFELNIHVYKSYPNVVPEIEECGGKIPKNFHMNGRYFCLAVPIEMLLYSKNHTVGEFLSKYLNSYLMSFVCYQEYGFCPYGDRNHGIPGKLEHIMEYFRSNNSETAIKLLEAAITGKLGRNDKCTCGSGSKYKKCHLDAINILLRDVGRHELITTYKEVIRYLKK